jgi:putative MATE family efflux protein
MGTVINVKEGKRATRRAVLILAWPAIIEMLLQMMVGLFDTAMVGRLGASALAAVGLGAQVSMIFMTIFSSLTTGTVALVARAIGAGQEEDAGVILRQSLIAGGSLAILVTILIYSFAESILHLLFSGVGPDALHHAASYVRITALSMLPLVILITINGALRGSGNTKTPMTVTGIVNVVNIVLNYVLIFGHFGAPALGIRGAAIATAIAQTAGAVIVSRKLFSGSLNIHFTLRDDYGIKMDVLKRILAIGIPAAMEQAILRIGQVLYIMTISSLGTVAYAAHQVALNAESLSYMPGSGFALAATALVGQGLGANAPKKAEEGGLESAKMAVWVMAVMGVIFFLFSPWLVRFFTNDQEVVELAAVCLKIVGVCQPALALVMVLGGGLRGAGYTRRVLVITTVGFIGVRVPLAYILIRYTDLGLVGAWLAMGVDLILRAILLSVSFFKGHWKEVKV